MDLAWEWYPILFATGLVAGWVDAIAGGGGLLTVPMLLATDLEPQMALGTNKFQSSLGTTMATVQYARHGLLRWREVAPGVTATALGALAGAFCVSRVDPQVLRPVIPGLLMAIAAVLALKPDLGREARPPSLTGALLRWRASGLGGHWISADALRETRIFFALGCGLALGFYDGFFGPGTGTFWTMAGLLLMGWNLLTATAHTKAMNLASNLASLALFLLAGQVRFGIGVAMALGQMLGGRLGAGVAVRGGAGLIRPIFLSMVVLLSGRLLWEFVARLRG
ncbi:MAG: TSUP family transporter [Verrucomicrobiota bacterium]